MISDLVIAMSLSASSNLLMTSGMMLSRKTCKLATMCKVSQRALKMFSQWKTRVRTERGRGRGRRREEGREREGRRESIEY